jgi:hypothetical protein
MTKMIIMMMMMMMMKNKWERKYTIKARKKKDSQNLRINRL